MIGDVPKGEEAPSLANFMTRDLLAILIGEEEGFPWSALSGGLGGGDWANFLFV
jgi:hypothetical protein